MTDKLIKFAKKVPDNIKELYHISFNSNLEGKWTPKKPDGDYDENTSSDLLPEVTDARISLSPTIEKCFQAIYANVKHFIKDKTPLTFNVYTPVYSGKEWIVYPETLTKQKFVHDAHITKEHCILTPVYMKLVGKVEITTTGDKDKLEYYAYGIETKDGYYGWVPAKVTVEKVEESKPTKSKSTKLFS